MSGVEIKMLHAGAITQVVRAVVPEFEKQTGHKVTLHRDTAGALTKLIEGGEAVRSRAAHAGRDRQADRAGQVRARQPHQYRARRRRRGGQGGHAAARYQQRRGVQERAPEGEDRRLYRSACRRVERHLCRGSAREARHRQGGQRQGEADPWRRGRDPYRQGCRRARRAPDQRNPSREGDRAGRAAAEGDPELHHLCRRHRRQRQAGRGGAGADQGVCQSGQRGADPVEGAGAGRS